MEDPASRQSPIQTCFGGISGLAASSNFITTAQALKLQLVDCARVPVLTVLLHAQSSQCENAACFGVGPASTSKTHLASIVCTWCVIPAARSADGRLSLDPCSHFTLSWEPVSLSMLL